MQILTTADGSNTLYLPDLDEQYHSLNGAFTESMHVYIQNGYNFHDSTNPVVFEVGFGTGLNCLLTALQSEKLQRPTLYISAEKFPVKREIWEQLNFGKRISEEAAQLFNQIHESNWEQKVQISPYFTLQKLKIDMHDLDTSKIEKCDVVYFDAFGPGKQPDMWTPEVFSQISNLCNPKAVFVTYSAKGQVRRDLQSTGFAMKRVPGPPGKNEMLQGIKQIPII